MTTCSRPSLACAWLSFVIIAIATAGCGTSAATVAGTVSVGGQPLQQGRINFSPIEDTPGGSSGAAIIDGQFDVPEGLQAGKYRIQIDGTRDDPEAEIQLPFGGPLVPKPVPVVPELYRGQNSPLTATLKAGHQSIPFDVPEISESERRR